MTETLTNIEKHRMEQRTLYGAPLNELLGRCGQVLELSQARIASLLGISAPMLSQLIGGHRIKIGNPVAAHRLQVLLEGVDHVADGAASIAEVIDRVQATTTTDGQAGTTRRATATDQTRAIQGLFRRQASAIDYIAAADLLHRQFPEIADLLRIYGAGREAEATRHFSRET